MWTLFGNWRTLLSLFFLSFLASGAAHFRGGKLEQVHLKTGVISLATSRRPPERSMCQPFAQSLCALLLLASSLPSLGSLPWWKKAEGRRQQGEWESQAAEDRGFCSRLAHSSLFFLTFSTSGAAQILRKESKSTRFAQG